VTRRYTRHDTLPVFEQRTARLPANLYNRVTLNLKPPGGVLRLPLHGLRRLDAILQPDAWIVVDSSLDDVPLLAWSDFRRVPGQRLHGPVACRLRLFHAQAGLLLERVLRELATQVADLRVGGSGGGRILRFPGA
jgi:hypothetical protein